MSTRAKLLSLHPVGFWRAAVSLADEIGLQYHHQKSVRLSRQLVDGADLKLHLGCGPNRKPGWINIDLYDAGADLRLDMRERLPFKDNSVSLIYSEHFFEHVAYPGEVMHLLSESRRILVPNGRFSVGVPDTVLDVRTYLTPNPSYEKDVWDHWHPKWCNTRMHHLNYHFHQEGEHKYSYDFETLAQVLTEGGFVEAHQRAWDPDLDQESRRDATLYVDAFKPGG